MFIFVLLSTIWIFFKGFYFIYLFQTKEYRFDRTKSAFKDKGLFKLFYSFQIKLPAMTGRNVLISLFHALTVFILFLYAFENIYAYQFLSFFLPLAPFVSFIIIAVGVVLTSIPAQINREIIILRAKRKVNKTGCIFIGITGSYGKTSVKEYLHHILSHSFSVAKTDKNRNTDVGVALSILQNLNSDTDYFVAEFGAYRTGEIAKASGYIPLKYTVLTGLGNQHLDLYGSRNALIKEETSLLYKTQDDGDVYANNTVPNAAMLKEDFGKRVHFYSLDSHVSIYCTKIHGTFGTTKAVVHYKDISIPIETKLLGKHSVENLLPCIAIAHDQGMSVKAIQKAVSSIVPISGKLSVHTGYGKATILNDSANSNVDGFLAAVETFTDFQQKNKIIVSQGIIELGVEKRKSYEKIVHKLNNTPIKLFTTDILFNTIKETKSIITFNDVKSLKKAVLKRMNKGTAVLIEGKFPKPFIDTLIS